jgi:hypothetical protein
MSILAGDNPPLAMEAEIDEVAEGWTWGRFRMWVQGQSIGNWEDTADLGGVVRWIRDLIDNPRLRRESALDGRSKEEIFRLIYDPVMARTARPGIKPPIEDAYTRFHIAHIGMSSFDAYDVLLLEEATGQQRLLWRLRDGDIQEAYLPPREMERVAGEFCKKMRPLLSAA